MKKSNRSNNNSTSIESPQTNKRQKTSNLAEEAEEIDDVERQLQHLPSFKFPLKVEDTSVYELNPTEKEVSLWNSKLTTDIQKQCIKEVGRLFLFKGFYVFIISTNSVKASNF
jgi:hypothetical protein